jgi:diguanylate cyclase (GGDEF)-like protein
LFIPEGLMVLACAALVQWPSLLAPAQSFLPAVPAVVLGLGLALAIRFRRTRVFFALLVLAAADRGLLAAPELRNVIALLVPINLAVLGIVPERGFLTMATALRAVLVASQAGFLALLSRLDDLEIAALLEFPFLPAVVSNWSPLADPVVVVYAIALLFFGGVFLGGPNATARGFFWAQVASLLALSTTATSAGSAIAGSTLLFVAGGLVLGTAVLEASHDMAYRDALTGLQSRRALDDALHALGGGFTIAMVDVDHFKKCNDTYGHDSGDQVLRMIATQLNRVGSGGRVFRYGGEEFAILFPDRDVDSCLEALENLRASIEKLPFTVRAADRPRKKPKQPRKRVKTETIAVTVSMGVGGRTSSSAPADEVITAADDALYRAKKAGRNRIMVAAARAQKAQVSA